MDLFLRKSNTLEGSVSPSNVIKEEQRWVYYLFPIKLLF